MKKLLLAQTFDLDVDEAILKGLVDHLKIIDLPYKITQQDSIAQLFVYHQEHLSEITAFITQHPPPPKKNEWLKKPHLIIFIALRALRTDPACLVCIILSAFCFGLFLFKSWDVLSLFTFQDFKGDDYRSTVSAFDTLINIFYDAEIWRLFSPVFLHFTWHSLTFNVLVFYYLGLQIERKEGTISLIITLVFLAFISNVSQFYLLPNTLFGGLTGIAYGLAAYCWLSNRYHKEAIYHLSPAFIALMLVIALVGSFDLYGINWVYSAHLGPFVAGCVLVFFSTPCILENQPRINGGFGVLSMVVLLLHQKQRQFTLALN